MSKLTLFQIDKRELRQLEMFMKKLPLKFSSASAGMLNNFAFGTRTESLEVINRRFTVRSKAFMKRIVRVQKAKGNQPMNEQQSITGSISMPRFSGLEEQELGTRTKRTRVATQLARGGNKQKKIKPSVRLKSANQFLSQADFPGKTAHHRTVVMLQTLFRKKHRRPIIITKHRRFRKGLYKIVRGKLKMLQSFEPRNLQPRRIRWLTTARKSYFATANIRELWAKELNRVLKKSKRR